MEVDERHGVDERWSEESAVGHDDPCLSVDGEEVAWIIAHRNAEFECGCLDGTRGRRTPPPPASVRLADHESHVVSCGHEGVERRNGELGGNAGGT